MNEQPHTDPVRRLAECELLLAAAFDAAPVGMGHLDLEGRWLRVNAHLAALAQRPAAQWTGRSCEEMCAPEDAAPLRADLAHLLETGGPPIERDVRLRRGGEYRLCHFRASLFRDSGGVPRFINCSVEDISDSARAEETLQRSTDLLDKVFSGVNVLLAYMDRDFNFIKVNPAYAAADQRDPEFFVGKNHFALYPNPENEAMFRLVVETGLPSFITERPFTYPAHPEWGTKYFDWVLRPVRRPDGYVEGLVLSIQDVTEKVQVKQELQATAAYSRSLIEANLDPLVTIGRDGRITDVNAATEAVTGHPRDALIGTDFCEYFTDPGKAREGYQRAFEQGFVRDFPLEICHADGHLTPVLYNASVYRDPGGEIAGVLAAARDITRLREVEEAIRQSEARLRQAQRLTHIGNWELDLVSGVLYWSDEIYRIFEIDKEEFGASYQAFLDLIHPDDRAAVDEAYTRSVATRTPYSIDHRLLFPDGRVKYVHEQSETLYDDAGRPLCSIGTVQDITERKLAEEALREANAYNRRLIEASLDPLVTIGRDGTITDVNEATTKATGRSREQLIGTDFSDYFTDPEHARAGYRQAFEQGEVRDYALEIRHADGHTIPVLYNASVYRDEAGEVVGVYAAARDITELRNAARALRKANAYNRSLLEASLDPLVTIDRNGCITDVNKATEEATGLPREKLIGTDFSEYFTQPEKAREGYRKAFERGYVRDYPLDLRHINGHATPVIYNAAVYRDESGEVSGVFAAARDISARRKAEEEVTRLSRRNALLLESAGEGIYGFDTDGRCSFVNPAGAKMLGYAPEELVGRNGHEVFHHSRPDGRPYPASECPIQRTYTEGRVFRGTDEYFWRRDGSGFPIEYVSTPILEEGKVLGAVVAFLDITERKRAEQELRTLNHELDARVKARTAELEAANKELESFSYSVSHDLRTPLRAIDGFSRILLTDYAEQLDEEGQRLLQVVRENTDRMGKLIGDILSFSRTGRAEMRRVEVNMTSMVQEVWEEVRQTEPERRYDFRLAALPPVCGDRALLRQVFINLLSNAVKFSRPREIAHIEVDFEEHPDEIIYCVRDNGVGFEMAYVDRLFGVFQRLHSTSEFEGTGIGLALVKRIVARHGGRIWADSRLDEGSSFHVALPRAEQCDE
ncbi:MAG: PAS domain S-box protein [Gammaproteobacteria bacterium]|nr:PAS domain S-box protein [Gammaproteobacteria bacterium]